MDNDMQMPTGLTMVDPSQYDLHNETQAAEFLELMLDDSVLKQDAQKFSKYFWYGIVVVIGIVAVNNWMWRAVLTLR